VSGGSHDDRSGNLSEVIGSERPATDVGAHQLPLGKSAMLPDVPEVPLLPQKSNL